MSHTLKKIMHSLKKFIYLGLVAGIAHIFLFWGTTSINQTFAEDPSTTFQATLDKNKQLLDELGKWFYILIMPLLVVAGYAMDNSMVYGSVFWFDAALRNIWNLTKNIANFLLWFLFLFFLLKSLADGKGSDTKKVVTNTLIAGVLIQASRFVVAAAVDISTIATYGVGGVPLSILGDKWSNGNQRSETNPYTLGREIYIGMQEENKSQLIRTSPVGNISPCEVRLFKWTTASWTESLIIGKSLLYYEKKSGRTGTIENVCHYYGDVYRYKKGYGDAEGNGATAQSNHTSILENYRKVISSGDNSTTTISEKIKEGNVLQIAPPSTKIFKEGTGAIVIKNPITATGGGEIGLDKNLFKLAGGTGNANKLSTLSDLLDRSKSYVGVFGTMYGSLLNLGSGEFWFGEASNSSSWFLRALTNGLYCAALFIPLVALVVVLVFRIGILRIVIALSPIIIIMKVFWFEEKLKNSMEHLKIENIIKLLLAPVLIGFAVSLSTVFLEIIINIAQSNIYTESTDILGIIDINIQGGAVNIAKLITIIAGVALSRFLLFWAIKMNEIGKKIGGKLQSSAQGLAKQRLGNIPIIPTSTWGVWINAIGGTFDKITDSIKQKQRAENNKQITKLFEGTAFEKAYPLESTDANARTTSAVNGLTTGELDQYYEQLTNNKYQTRNTELTTRYTNSEGKSYDLQLKGNDIIENQNHLLHLLGKNITPTDDAKEKYAELVGKAVDNAKKITTEKDFKELMRIIGKNNPKEEIYKGQLRKDKDWKPIERQLTNDKNEKKTYTINWEQRKLEEKTE